jgi:mannitol-specific phosphotransferase system IIBC component
MSRFARALIAWLISVGATYVLGLFIGYHGTFYDRRERVILREWDAAQAVAGIAVSAYTALTIAAILALTLIAWVLRDDL